MFLIRKSEKKIYTVTGHFFFAIWKIERVKGSSILACILPKKVSSCIEAYTDKVFTDFLGLIPSMPPKLSELHFGHHFVTLTIAELSFLWHYGPSISEQHSTKLNGEALSVLQNESLGIRSANKWNSMANV